MPKDWAGDERPPMQSAGEDRTAQAALMLEGVPPTVIARQHPARNCDRGYAAEFGLTAARSGQDRAAMARIATRRELDGAGARDVCDRGSGIAQLQVKTEVNRGPSEGLAPRQRRQPAGGADPRGGDRSRSVVMKAPRSGAFLPAGILRMARLNRRDHHRWQDKIGKITRAGDEVLRACCGGSGPR